jgi:hypothetical protein
MRVTKDDACPRFIRFCLCRRQTNNASCAELPFVTLSQATPAQSLVASLFAGPTNGARHDKAMLVICEKAAESRITAG